MDTCEVATRPTSRARLVGAAAEIAAVLATLVVAVNASARNAIRGAAHVRAFGTAKRRIGMVIAALVAVTLPMAHAVPAANAAGSFQNRALADWGYSYWSSHKGNEHFGQCIYFMEKGVDAVWPGHPSFGSADSQGYEQIYRNVGAQLVVSVSNIHNDASYQNALNKAQPGDVIQFSPSSNSWSDPNYTGHEHTTIVYDAPNGNPAWNVVDANWSSNNDEMVRVHRGSDLIGAKAGLMMDIWRLGTGSSSPSLNLEPAAGYTNVAQNSDGRLEVFSTSSGGTPINHAWEAAPSSGPWQGWSSLGGATRGTPAVARNTDGRIEVFVVGGDGQLYHTWQTNPASGPWSSWSAMGGSFTEDPSVVQNADGRLEIFAVGTDGQMYHAWQNTAATGPWSTWSSLGGSFPGRAVAVRNVSGTMEVFAIGANGQLDHNVQTNPGAGPWSGWSSLGGSLVGNPAVAMNSGGRVEVFAVGTNGQMDHIYQTNPASGPWSSWSSLGGTSLSRPVVATNASGTVEVFAVGADRQLYHAVQQNPGSGPWSSFASMGGQLIDQPGVAVNSNGTLEVFVLGTDAQMYHDYQTSPSSGPWSGWNLLIGGTM